MYMLLWYMKWQKRKLGWMELFKVTFLHSKAESSDDMYEHTASFSKLMNLMAWLILLKPRVNLIDTVFMHTFFLFDCRLECISPYFTGVYCFTNKCLSVPHTRILNMNSKKCSRKSSKNYFYDPNHHLVFLLESQNKIFTGDGVLSKKKYSSSPHILLCHHRKLYYHQHNCLVKHLAVTAGQ